MAFSFLDLAKEVLEQENIPLSVEEMWEAANRQGLLEKLSSSGKTPIRTLSAGLYVDIKNNENSIFIKVSKRPDYSALWAHPVRSLAPPVRMMTPMRSSAHQRR